MSSKNQFLESFFQLNSEEIKGFVKFIKSRYEKGHEFLGVLGIISRTASRDIRGLKIKIFESVYAGISYDDLKIRVLLSDLLAELKQYLTLSNLGPHESELNYLKFLRLRNLNRLFESQSRQLKEKMKNEKIFNENNYAINYQIDFEKFRFESRQNRFRLEGFSELLINFEHSVIIQRLKLYLEYVNFKNFVPDASVYKEFEDQIQNLISRDWSLFPEIQMNVLALRLFIEFENDQVFESFNQYLNLFSSKMEPLVRKDFYYTVLNYCIRKINLDRDDYFNHVLRLYDHGVSEQWILDNGYMTSVTYKNIVSLCIRMKEFELAEQLMLKYKHIVHRSERESIFEFNQARILKEKGNIRQALLLLNSNRYKDPLIDLHVRIELIKIYYEINEENLLHSQILSIIRFVNKAGRFGSHKIYYLNFIRFVQSLISIRDKQSSIRKNNKILLQIKNEPDLIERAWLVQVASSL